MRDDPHDKPIPEKFKPSDWHIKERDKAREKLKELDGISIATCDVKAKAEYDEECKRIGGRIEESNKLTTKYKVMLTQVMRWQPPTLDHVNFKEFMVEQIEKSIEFDDMSKYYLENQPELLTGEKWLSQKRKALMNELQYHIKADAKERERVEGRNAWIQALRDNL